MITKSSAINGRIYWRNKMKFSVLIPVYNAEKYLDECLGSIFKQTCKNFEIILIDDGSTDNSATICDRYQKDFPDIVRVIHQENQGQLVSRCNAIKAAQSDYCIFMDADDLIVENALETLNGTIDKYNSPDMVVYSFYYEYENGEKKRAQKLCEDATLFDNNNKIECYKKFYECTLLNNVWTKCVKTKVVQSIEFNFSKYQRLRCSEDRLHSMLMVDACETVVYIYEHLYRYKLVEGSVTRKYTVDSIEKFNSIVLYEVEKTFINKWKLETPLYEEKLNAQCMCGAFYVFDLYYNNVAKKDRRAVLEYDWCSFLNSDILCGMVSNSRLNSTQKQLWDWIKNKNYIKLKSYFFKKKVRKLIKKIIG